MAVQAEARYMYCHFWLCAAILNWVTLIYIHGFIYQALQSFRNSVTCGFSGHFELNLVLRRVVYIQQNTETYRLLQ